MAEFSPLEVSVWIKVDEPLLHVTTHFWIPSQHVFLFNDMEICSTLEEFSAIMGEPRVSTLILPTTSEDFADLAYDLLGISLAMSRLWCMLDHVNIRMVFLNTSFSWPFL